MAAEHGRTVREFFDAWVQRDPGRLTSFFAPGGTWTEANREPAQGHDAIRAVFDLQTSFASDFSFEFTKLTAAGDTVFTERVDRFVINDTPMVVHVAGIFEFDADGRIAAWRDYYDWQSLERQLTAAGVDLSGVHSA